MKEKVQHRAGPTTPRTKLYYGYKHTRTTTSDTSGKNLNPKNKRYVHTCVSKVFHKFPQPNTNYAYVTLLHVYLSL